MQQLQEKIISELGGHSVDCNGDNCVCFNGKTTSKLLNLFKEQVIEKLPDCSGCTYDKEEGTHQGLSKQHFEDAYLNTKKGEEDATHKE